MAPGNATVAHLAKVLQTVATGQPTAYPMTTYSQSHDAAYSIDNEGNSTAVNGSSTLVSSHSTGDVSDAVWLSVRLFVIFCVITGLVVLTWGSYTLHRKCFDEKRKRKYHKALLL